MSFCNEWVNIFYMTMVIHECYSVYHHETQKTNDIAFIYVLPLRKRVFVPNRVSTNLWTVCVHDVNITLPRMHYENTPMQYTAIFNGCKNDNFQLNFFDYFHIFAQNIYCGYTLEPPR